jgi:hypothetical protein
MSESDRDPAGAGPEDRFLEEHRRLEEVLRHVAHAHGLGELALALRDLRTLLEPHFGYEEAPGGFFEMVRERAALHVGRVEQLRQEHASLLREVDRVGEETRACLAGPVAAVLKQATELARRLAKHEARERELLIDAMNTDGDSGSGD